MSSVTLAELRFGIRQSKDPDQVRKLEVWLESVVRPMFAGRVLQITEDVMLRWRILVEEGRKRGRTLPQTDLIIAAIALEHGLTLVTRDVRDFEGLGLTILNRWEAEV